MTRVLIVRLTSLGDIVHALPVAAALRAELPDARIDWLVDSQYRAVLDLVPVVNRRLVVGSSRFAGRRRGDPRPGRIGGWRGLSSAVAELRRSHYDVALDLQGLLKSAVLVRCSGAARIIGFSRGHLREPLARFFYTTTHDPGPAVHVVQKNLSMLAAIGLKAGPPRFPIEVPALPVVEDVRRRLDLSEGQPFAILNPGAGWPNKRWPVDRFAAVAVHLRDRHGLKSAVLWGRGESTLASLVSAASSSAAVVAPPTRINEVVSLLSNAALVVGGDTGPIHVAAALGRPVVGLFGPSDPARNGPWDPADLVVSRYERCECRYQRRCRRQHECIADIDVDEVCAAVDRRLAGVR